MHVAGMGFRCLFTCGIWGPSPLRVRVGTRAWPAGFEKGSLRGGKPFLTHLLTQNPRSFSLTCGTTLFWRESYGSRWDKLNIEKIPFLVGISQGDSFVCV